MILSSGEPRTSGSIENEFHPGLLSPYDQCMIVCSFVPYPLFQLCSSRLLAAAVPSARLLYPTAEDVTRSPSCMMTSRSRGNNARLQAMQVKSGTFSASITGMNCQLLNQASWYGRPKP